MPPLNLPLRRVGRVLTDHVRRLRAALTGLAGQVRAAVARVIGQATGEAVRDALGVILEGPPARPSTEQSHEDRQGLWGQPRRPRWPGPSFDVDDPDDDEPERYRESAHGRGDDELPDPTTSAPSCANAWSRAVATGCQAASWWLQRYPGRFSLLAATAIGVAAGVTTLVGSPFVTAGSAVAASALGILALADAARSAADLVAETVE
jgi:hypothetical protein